MPWQQALLFAIGAAVMAAAGRAALEFGCRWIDRAFGIPPIDPGAPIVRRLPE